MSDWKSFFASRTVWANLVGLAALVASSLGIDVAPADQEGATDALLQVVAGLRSSPRPRSASWRRGASRCEPRRSGWPPFMASSAAGDRLAS